MESKIIFIFLDIDGVLNNENYIIKCYKKHGKPMHMNYVPFDPKCLNELMLLVQEIEANNYKVKIILSSTWRLHKVDYEIVNARLAEYGLHLTDKTPYISNDRGTEIQEFLKNKTYTDILILDDDKFDIINKFPTKLINTKFQTGFTKKHRLQCLDLILGKDRKQWEPKIYN